MICLAYDTLGTAAWTKSIAKQKAKHNIALDKLIVSPISHFHATCYLLDVYYMPYLTLVSQWISTVGGGVNLDSHGVIFLFWSYCYYYGNL